MRSLFLSAGALGALFLLAAPSAAAAPDVAVVDMIRLLQEHPESRALDAALEEERKGAEKNMQAAREQIKAQDAEIKKMNEKDPERREKARILELQKITAEFDYKWSMQQAFESYVSGLEMLYEAIARQVREYAREHQILLVLQKQDIASPLNAQNIDDFGIKQRLRVVVWHVPEVDVTEAVLERIRAANAAPR